MQASNNTLNSADSLCFVLPPVMTIETAEALAGELKQLPLTEKSTLILDASKVENITTPGLQLIISLEKTIEGQGGTMLINAKTEAMINAFKDSGLKNLMEMKHG